MSGPLFLPTRYSFVKFKEIMYKILILMALFVASCSPEPTKPVVTLDQKIGAMLIVGFRGDSPRSAKHIAKQIQENHLGGVILFNSDPLVQGSQRNVKSPAQLMMLTRWLQGLSDQELFIAIDQEGGKVSRLQKKHGFPDTLSAMESYKDPVLFRKNNKVIASTLHKYGINLNFSPVVDLGVDSNNFIFAKERIYSSESIKVVDAARKVIQAHHKYGVSTVLKHFPGHGSSKADSHKGFADVSSTWSRKELTPYVQLKGETDMIMTSHIYNNSLDHNYPATLSANIMTDLLRKEIGYEGIVITDDLGMKAISDHYTLYKSVTLAINAGVDVLLLANSIQYNEDVVEDVIGIIKKQVHAGRIPMSRINESYARIQKLRAKMKNRSEPTELGN